MVYKSLIQPFVFFRYNISIYFIIRGMKSNNIIIVFFLFYINSTVTLCKVVCCYIKSVYINTFESFYFWFEEIWVKFFYCVFKALTHSLYRRLPRGRFAQFWQIFIVGEKFHEISCDRKKIFLVREVSKSRRSDLERF